MLTQALLLLASASTIVLAHHGTPHRAIVKLCGNNGNEIQGNITFTETEDGKIRVQGTIYGMPPGQYGFHVHEKGDITGGCGSSGPHFNPENMHHGHPQDEVRHVGDLGNVVFDTNNVSNIDFVDPLLALEGPHNIIGRTVVLHEREDDFGRTSHPDSRKTGNAGGRVACGVIGILDSDKIDISVGLAADGLCTKGLVGEGRVAASKSFSFHFGDSYETFSSAAEFFTMTTRTGRLEIFRKIDPVYYTYTATSAASFVTSKISALITISPLIYLINILLF